VDKIMHKRGQEHGFAGPSQARHTESKAWYCKPGCRISKVGEREPGFFR